MTFPTILLFSALAQGGASALMVATPLLYSKLNAGQEAWPVLFLTLAAAFVFEWVFFRWAYRKKLPEGFNPRTTLAIGLSWVAGLLSFLFGGSLARVVHIQPPFLAWAVALLVLSSLMDSFFKRKSDK